MALPHLKYIAWREQDDGAIRPRFKTGPHLRRAFDDCDLKHASGHWFTVDETVAWWRERMAEIEAQRGGEAGERKRRPPVRRGETVGDLLDDFLASADFKRARELGGYADSSRDDYRAKVAAIKFQPPDRVGKRARELFSQSPARAVDDAAVKGFFEHLEKIRGLHMARGCIMVLSAAFKWSKTAARWKLRYNPCRDLDLPNPSAAKHGKRPIVVLDEREIDTLILAADTLPIRGAVRPSIGDALMLGYETGQRQGDRLAIEDAGLDAEGRRLFRQSKRGAVVAIRESYMPQLERRLESARKRRAEIALKFGSRAREIVLNEATGRRWTQSDYKHCFAVVRHAAVHGIVRIDGELIVADFAVIGANLAARIRAAARDAEGEARGAGAGKDETVEWLVRPCPSVAHKKEMHLRHTAITQLALAGATLQEIAAISGHSLKTIFSVIEHYLGARPELADSALAKRMAWRQKKGMAV